MAPLTSFLLLLAGLTYTHALGTQTQIQELPSIAQIQFRLANTWRQQCVGSIITNFHIVTTGTCAGSEASTRRIIVASDRSGAGGLTYGVNSMVNHPQADLSVIRAALWFIFGPTVQNIQIVPQGFFIPAHIGLSLAGWGITAQGGLVANDNLYSLNIESKAITVCMAQYPDRVDATNLCVGLVDMPGRDFDPSDAGAPIIYQNFLTGIASFGESVNDDQSPIVTTAVGAFTNWIVQAAN